MLNATKTEFVKHKGKITDEREVIAWVPRIASLELAFRIRGMYKSEQEKKDAEHQNRRHERRKSVAGACST